MARRQMYSAEVPRSLPTLRSWTVDREEAAEARAEAPDALGGKVKVIGAFLLAFPFVAMFIWMGVHDGWDIPFKVFGTIALLVVWIGVAVVLLVGR